MNRLVSAALLTAAVSLGGCLYWDTSSQPTGCGVVQGGISTGTSLVDPATLLCESFNIPTCDPDCGGCPPSVKAAPTVALPTWGSCSSTCRGLDESSCGATTGCRIARDASCFFAPPGQACLDDFAGCYSTDQIRQPAGTCAGLDAYECSQHDDCAAIYDAPHCNTPGCTTTFVACAPEHAIAGSCTGGLSCAQKPPLCPSGTVAGIANGCWTGVCIPQAACLYPPGL
jgi:hypothetical protein